MTEKRGGAFVGFLSGLSSLGLIEETPDRAASDPAKRVQAPAGASTDKKVHSDPAQPKGDAVAADPEVLAKLEQRLQHNCPVAYGAFLEQLENLKDVIPDESMRLRAALKASHTSVEQLVGALDSLMATMDAAGAEFARTFNENRDRRLHDADLAIKAIDDQIAAQERQLQSVQEAIVALRARRETDAQAMQQEALRLEGIRLSFASAHAQVTGRLSAQKSRVQAIPKV